MTTLPGGLIAFTRTPDFTASTVPSGLLHQHRTQPGVWGRIVVLDGSVLYRILVSHAEEITLSPGQDGIVEPGTAHEVVPSEGARFFVEFYKRAT